MRISKEELLRQGDIAAAGMLDAASKNDVIILGEVHPFTFAASVMLSLVLMIADLGSLERAVELLETIKGDLMEGQINKGEVQ
jgi:hypothetical protein